MWFEALPRIEIVATNAITGDGTYTVGFSEFAAIQCWNFSLFDQRCVVSVDGAARWLSAFCVSGLSLCFLVCWRRKCVFTVSGAMLTPFLWAALGKPRRVDYAIVAWCAED